MKHFILTALLMNIAALCWAQDETYVRFDTGFSIARDPHLKIPEGDLPGDLGHSEIIGAGIGSRFTELLRSEMTVSYRGGFNHVSGFPDQPTGFADFHSLLLLGSVYYDLVTDDTWIPYIGGGAGIARNTLGRINITNVDGSTLGFINGASHWSFAWQLTGGLSYSLSRQFVVEGGYRFLNAGSYESSEILHFSNGTEALGKDRAKFRAQEFHVGIRLSLP